jgi:hypothetical protein
MGVWPTHADESLPTCHAERHAPEPALRSRASSGGAASGAGAQRSICFSLNLKSRSFVAPLLCMTCWVIFDRAHGL